MAVAMIYGALTCVCAACFGADCATGRVCMALFSLVGFVGGAFMTGDSLGERAVRRARS
jgi:hypothetical protein